jgi:hypothetical protein
MNCAEFQSWLDDGRPNGGMIATNAHRSMCPACERALAAALEIDRALSMVVPVAASHDFNDAVMRQIRADSVLPALLNVISKPLVPFSLAVLFVLACNLGRLSLAVPTTTMGILWLVPFIAAISWLLFRACARMTWAE